MDISICVCLSQTVTFVDALNLCEEWRQCVITLCKLFCDNSGAVELIRLPKIRPRTKHINSKLHHFREHVASGRITVQYVPTADQLADIATKPLGVELFSKFCKLILGW
jgi:hypothetical protein